MKRLGRGLLVLGALLVLAELGLRVAGAVYLRRLHPEPPPAPGDIRVMCLGESSTAGLWTQPGGSYPAQLERSLRAAWPGERIRVVVPPHLGQNTSQVANRIGDHLRRHRPRLVVVMAGYNNEWSLAESHIGSFLEDSGSEALRVRVLTALDGLRLFRAARWAWLKASIPAQERYLTENRGYAWGAPELIRYPPADGVFSFALRHRPAFVKLWRHDIQTIVRESRAAGARVLLMTYHINPTYLPAGEVVAMAEAEKVPLVRNDLTFAPLVADHTVERYLFHDGWHPNERGYALIAEGAYRAIVGHDLLGLGPARSAAPLEPEVPRFPAKGRLNLGTIEIDRFLGRGWGRPEDFFRWAEGDVAEILFRVDEREGRVLSARLRPFLVPGRLARQRVDVSLNGHPLAQWVLEASAETVRAAFLPADAMQAENVLRFGLPDASAPSRLGQGADDRVLSVALDWLDLRKPEPLPDPLEPADAKAVPFLGEGWSRVEGSFRWSEGRSAEIYFAPPAAEARRIRLRLHPFLVPGKLTSQRVTVSLNGSVLGTLRLAIPDARDHDLAIPRGLLGPANVLRLDLPDAASPASLGASDDPRVLAVAVEALRPLP